MEGQALHNIRNAPSIKAEVVGKIPSGVLFLGSEEIANEEGVWLVLHRQTLHSYDIAVAQPCFLNVLQKSQTRFAEKIK